MLAGAQCYEVADEEQGHVTLDARTVARPLSSFETLWEWFSGAWTKMGPTSVRDLTTFRLRRWQEIPQAVVDAVVRGRQGRLRRCLRLSGASIAGNRRVATGSRA